MKISLLGCGWLGLPLAMDLIKKGYRVKGSTTSREKISSLASEGIIPYQIKLFKDEIQGDITSFLSDADVLIIDIPPGLRKDPEENFIAKIGKLKDQFERFSLQHIIFISSTSVFDDREDIPVYTEGIEPNGTQNSSEQLIAAENLISSENSVTSILRFGGLFGPDRHPVNYLAGRKNIKDPEAPVNLIHRDDCIGLITAIIESRSGGIFHGVHPEHPLKEKYYLSIAENMGLVKPEFDYLNPSQGKLIKSVRVEEELRFSFSRNL